MVYIPIDGLEWPGVRISPYSKPGENGGIVPNQFYDGRTITLKGRVAASTVPQYNLNRRSLENALRIVQNSLNIAQPLTLKFLTIDGLSLQTLCFVSQPPKIAEKSMNHAEFMLQFYAPDHNLYDTSVQTFTINLSGGGGLVYPAIYPATYPSSSGGSLTVNNNGDSDTFPVLTFYGPLSNPYVKNQTLGVAFQADIVLASTDVLVCDMANKTMVLNGNQNAMQYFDFNNTWFSLQPGTTGNLITLGSGLSSDTGYMTISYQNAFIGV